MLQSELYVPVPSPANVVQHVVGAAVGCRVNVLAEAVVDDRVNQPLFAAEVVVQRWCLDAGEGA
jgi:hypothetical protein